MRAGPRSSMVRPRSLVRPLLLAALALAPPPASAGHAAPIPVLTTEVTYAKRLLDAGQPLVFVDLRPAAEFSRGRLPHALSIPLPELRRRYGEIPRTELVILYCDCPTEALDAAFHFVAQEGYANASVLPEGYRGWVAHGYPIEPR
jgi:rhodanese-related sulfurtransferase